MKIAVPVFNKKIHNSHALLKIVNICENFHFRGMTCFGEMIYYYVFSFSKAMQIVSKDLLSDNEQTSSRSLQPPSNRNVGKITT